MKKTKFAILAIGLVLLSGNIFFFLKANNLNLQLAPIKYSLQKLQGDLISLKTKNEKLIQKNKEFQTDAVSYVGLNTKLREEKQGFEQGLKKAQKVIETKEGELQRVTKELEGLKKKIVDDKKKQAMVIAQKLNQFQKEKKILKEEIDSLSKKLKKERGIYHYNLAIAYGQAKLYDEAIEAYKKSLTFEPDSPETYYNLGLIYENIKENPEEAIKHYLQYLEFNPNADDREEVEKWIKRLKRFHL